MKTTEKVFNAAKMSLRGA